MEAIKTRVFKNGNSQAVRIPSEMRTDRTEFLIQKIGEVYMVYPPDDPWLPTRMAIGTFSDDYMVDREQPVWDDVPEREGR